MRRVEALLGTYHGYGAARLNPRLTTFNPRRARVIPVLSDSNIFPLFETALHEPFVYNRLGLVAESGYFTGFTGRKAVFAVAGNGDFL